MKTRATCRLCSGAIDVAWKLEPTPLANEFLDSREASLAQEKFPLDLAVCQKCGHVQLVQVIPPERLFRHYLYTSGASPVYVRHLNDYVDQLVDRFAPKYVVEIASNDGTMLDLFMKRGVDVVGIEPSENLASQANSDGLPTVNAFFTEASGRKGYLPRNKVADLIVANHVLAHIDDLDDIVRGVDVLLAPDGVFVFEVGYIGDVLAGAHFDTIYHEHVSYHHLSPLLGFFERHGMHVFDAQEVDTQGGSLRIFVRRGPLAPTEKVRFAYSVDDEYMTPAVVMGRISGMWGRTKNLKNTLGGELRILKSKGARIAGYGAPAKATTFLHQLDIGSDELDFIVDDAPLKHGKFIPGKGIEILPPTALYEQKPDVVVVLAWNFAESIMAKHGEFRGRWLVPSP